MSSKITPLFPGADQAEAQSVASPVRRVEWLAALLDLSLAQTYDAIRTDKIPPEAVVRLGRSIRVIEPKILSWLGLSPIDLSQPTA